MRNRCHRLRRPERQEEQGASAKATSDRSYHMLEEIGVKPNVNYLVKVRNTEEAAAHHA
jgi:hypothetical protein